MANSYNYVPRDTINTLLAYITKHMADRGMTICRVSLKAFFKKRQVKNLETFHWTWINGPDQFCGDYLNDRNLERMGL